LTHSDNSSLLDGEVLTQTWIHKALVVFNKPATWFIRRLLIVFISMAVLARLVWSLVGKNSVTAEAVGCLYLFFVALDGLLFWTLPKRSLSFGSWTAQTTVLWVPRLAATLAMSIAAAVFGELWGITVLASHSKCWNGGADLGHDI